MLERLTGSLGGAVVGLLLTLGLHQLGFMSPVLALALGVPPLTLLAALKPAYRVAPITLIILLLTPNLQGMGPVEAAIQRMFEIAVGSVIALGVSLTVLPARAHDSLSQAIAQALGAMADLILALPRGMGEQGELPTILALHDRIRGFISKAEGAADEALRERASFLTSGVDPLPICRTMRRLRHDLAILGRTMSAPLPNSVGTVVLGPIQSLAEEVAGYVRATAEAFSQRNPPGSPTVLDAAFALQTEAMASLRQTGVARALPDDELTRLFGMGFALHQLRRDLQDLADRGSEFAR